MMMRSGWKMRPCQSSCHGQYHYFLFQRNARQQYYSIKQGMSMRHEAGLCNALLSSSHEVFSHEGTHLNPGAHTNASSSAKGANVLLSMDDDELKKLVVSMGEKPFRAKQITDAIYGKSRSKNIMDFRYLPQSFREHLFTSGTTIGRSTKVRQIECGGGVMKLLLELADGHRVEAVGIPERFLKQTKRRHKNRESGNDPRIPEKMRLTICVSSQVGCAMRCSFCATGKMGFSRNLNAAEIVDQVLWMEEVMDHRVNNIVYMGMGEPLNNYRNVVSSVRIIMDKLGLGGRHFTISTVGVPNMIGKLASLKMQLTLAVSLHAPTQALRKEIVPAASGYPLEALLEDCRKYFEVTGRRVSFEYTLMKHVNDNRHDAFDLAALMKNHGVDHFHVNVIPYNPIDNCDFIRPNSDRVSAFVDELLKGRIQCSIRSTRGSDENAACGQLTLKSHDDEYAKDT